MGNYYIPGISDSKNKETGDGSLIC
jgi:hypothetical protein